jgi:hypothetical protein
MKSDTIDLTKEQKSEQWKKDMLLSNELDGWVCIKSGGRGSGDKYEPINRTRSVQ